MAEPDRSVKRDPVQQRSKDSTNRMLDAALLILERDGLQGLTIAAVAQEAGVGVGTIYHRFKDRMGLVIATEDRFLNKLEEQWETLSADVLPDVDKEVFLQLWLEGNLASFKQYPNTFRAFIVTFNDHPELRRRGTASSRTIGSFIIDALVDKFGCSRGTADTAFRITFGDGTVEAMFSAAEVTPEPVSTEERIRHLRIALTALLNSDTPPPADG